MVLQVVDSGRSEAAEQPFPILLQRFLGSIRPVLFLVCSTLLPGLVLREAVPGHSTAGCIGTYPMYPNVTHFGV